MTNPDPTPDDTVNQIGQQLTLDAEGHIVGLGPTLPALPETPDMTGAETSTDAPVADPDRS